MRPAKPPDEAAASGGGVPGAAYVFARDQGGVGNWGEVEKLMASDAQSLAYFGFSVAISGDTAVVGARNADSGGLGVGAAYVFLWAKTNGEPCASGSECESGYCVDSVCCDTPCGSGE